MKISKSQKYLKWLIAFVFVLIIFLGINFFYPNSSEKITNFEECADAGNPVMESYPRQCRVNGEIFVEELTWENDGIILMQNSETGQYACFGCGKPLCIDPAPIMKIVNETLQKYCSDEFEIIE